MVISDRLVSSAAFLHGVLFLMLIVSTVQAQNQTEQEQVVRFPPRAGIQMPQGVPTQSYSHESPREKGGSERALNPTLKPLPQCTQTEVRRAEVFHSSLASSFFEAVYFDPKDPAQAAQARSYRGRSVPYVADTPLRKLHPLLSFASTLKLRCLPTLFHYPQEGGRRYREYVEGADAWTSAKAPVKAPAKAPLSSESEKPKK